MTQLLARAEVLETTGDPSSVEVSGVAYDSRRVVPGDLFCCVPGATADGHDFAAQAVDRGAVGLLCERLIAPLARPVVQAVVAPGRVRSAMAEVAAALYDHPARALIMAGVTGTNGKTTVTHLLGSILERAGHPTTVIGTLSGRRTTPESPDLQAQLAQARDRGVADGVRRAVAMEVSSHALDQSRVDAVRFDVAVFTNLSHDHLDYHPSMEAYFAAKARLFEPARSAHAVVWVDDPYGARLAAQAEVPVTAVSRADADAVAVGRTGSTFGWRGQAITLPLAGRVNVENALLAAEAARVLGVALDVVAEGLAGATPVPGRLQRVAWPPTPGPEPFDVLVDYAHTPAALTRVLGDARELAGPDRRVLVVFGCGGDRDRAKRPLMGAAATGGADLAVLTTDNPRNEDPSRIIDEVRAGVGPDAVRAGRLVVEPDRRRAIEVALAAARSGDVVVLAGKGHETTQEIGPEIRPFDDAEVAAEILGRVRPKSRD
jgi:UDP-N-acetylmuramoyl-L-alanyl-D-glutamate--2,6-diaminopimelate ligase